MPFASPFEPGVAFHYHFSGDVLASMLQVFPSTCINASLALSLAHDVMFALIGLATGLALLASGPKPVHVVGAERRRGAAVGPMRAALRRRRAVPRVQLLRALYLGLSPSPARRDVDVRRHRDRTAGRSKTEPRRPRPAAPPPSSRWWACSRSRTRRRPDNGLCLGIAWLLNPELSTPTRGAGLCGCSRVAGRVRGRRTWCSPRRWRRAGRFRSCPRRAPVAAVAAAALVPVDGRGLVALMADTCPCGRSCWRRARHLRVPARRGREGRARAGA